MSNEAAILALIADLYRQITALQQDRATLMAELEKRPPIDDLNGSLPFDGPSAGQARREASNVDGS